MPGCACVLSLFVAATLLCIIAGRDATTGENRRVQNSSEILAQSLRRQLMQDNYDYMSSESEEPQPPVRSEQNCSDETVLTEKEATGMLPDGDTKMENFDEKTSNHKKSFEVKNYKKLAGNLKEQKTLYFNAQSDDKVTQSISRENLYQKSAKRRAREQRYMDDIDEDMAKRYRSRYKYDMFDEDNSVVDNNVRTEQTATVKYKILKLRSPYRRSGQAAALIQEESPHGVSIVKLGIGPFPEFRLPPLRRQYMAVPHPLKALGDDEEELPPLSADHITIANEDNYRDVNDETSNTYNISKTYFNEGQNSLTVTVTPDEILVFK